MNSVKGRAAFTSDFLYFPHLWIRRPIYTTKINQTQGKKSLANIPATWFLPLTEHLRSLPTRKHAPCEPPGATEMSMVGLAKEKGLQPPSRQWGKSRNRREIEFSHISPCSEKISQEDSMSFFFAESQPVHQPFLLVGGRCLTFLLDGPLLGTKNRWTKLFRGHGKKPTSIDVSSTPMRFKSCQPAFQDDFFCIQPVLFFVCFSRAAKEIDNRLETPHIFMYSK